MTKTIVTDNLSYGKRINRVSSLCMAGNLVLALFKLFAGLIGKSQAMISDAVHSASDILGGLIVIVGAKFSEKEEDEDHPYGHERLEGVASLLLFVLLLYTGLRIAVNAGESILSGAWRDLVIPGRITLAAALISIVVKEIMYQYTVRQAEEIRSDSLKAEAWHHRSDALSSVGALAGIAGARLGFKILDPLAGFVISLFILKAAVDIFNETIEKMVDHRCDRELEEKIRRSVCEVEKVQSVDLLRTREFGRKAYVDLEISMDGRMSLEDSHRTAEAVHEKIEKTFPQIKHVMVHVNPC